MSTFIQQTLLQDETLVYMSVPHWIVYGPGVFLFVLMLFFWYFGSYFSSLWYTFPLINMRLYDVFTVLLLIGSVWQLVAAWVKRIASEYGVTDKRVIMKEGLVLRRSLEIFWDKIEAIHVYQSILGRVLNYGTISVVGTGSSHDVFAFVPEPLAFRHHVQAQIDRNLDKFERPISLLR